jgi:hypothetical protein
MFMLDKSGPLFQLAEVDSFLLSKRFAVQGVSIAMQIMIRDSTDGVMIPIPQVSSLNVSPNYSLLCADMHVSVSALYGNYSAVRGAGCRLLS